MSDTEEELLEYEPPLITDEERVLTLAAFMEYVSPNFFFTLPLDDDKVLTLSIAREILFPKLESRAKWASFIARSADIKFMILAYSWLMRHCAAIHDDRIWDNSLFQHAVKNSTFAKDQLAAFEQQSQGSIQSRHFSSWRVPADILGADTAVPDYSVALAVNTGAFSHLDPEDPVLPDRAAFGYLGKAGLQVQPPFSGGIAQCAQILNVPNLTRYSVWPLPPDTAAKSAEAEPMAAAEPIPQPTADTKWTFKHYTLDITILPTSPAGLWLKATLPPAAFDTMLASKELPIHLSEPLGTIQHGELIRDHHGFPWFRADGTLVHNLAPRPVDCPTAEQTRAFYRVPHGKAIPAAYMPGAQPISIGFAKTTRPTAVYLGVEVLTEDEQESAPHTHRLHTKLPDLPYFLGTDDKYGFVTWHREVQKWLATESIPKSKRTNYLKRYLKGEADQHWADEEPKVRQWYAEHRPSSYLNQDGHHYVPCTAMMKVLALRFCNGENLAFFRSDLLAFERAATQTADQYNSEFKAKLAMISAFGPAHQFDPLLLIDTYRKNSKLGLPTEIMEDGALVAFRTLDQIMTHGHAKYKELREAPSAQVCSLQTDNSRDKQDSKQGHRQGSKQGNNHQQQGGRKQSQVAALQAQLEELQATVAAFSSTTRGKRQGPYQTQQGTSNKRPRFPDPPPDRRRSDERRNDTGSDKPPDTGNMYCRWCNTHTHDTEDCRILKSMDSAGKLPKEFQNFRNSRE
jgi:hypothetical protein